MCRFWWTRVIIEGGIAIYDGDEHYCPDAWVVTAVANNAARRHEMNEFGETVLALILAGF